MTTAQLLKAAAKGQSVTGFAHPYVMSAHDLASLQFILVMQFLPDLKIYKPKRRKKNEQATR